MVEVGDILLCIVEKINGTVVFVKTSEGIEGSIVLSEVAPGRIRNLRDYVFPGKSIICKVLRINREHLDLSLRRVTPKETKELRESLNKDKSYVSILKSVLGDDFEELNKKILLESDSDSSFLEEAKKDSSLLESIVGKERASKILEIVNSQKKKSVEIKKNFGLSSSAPNGIILIKSLLTEFSDVSIKYLAAGKYSISAEAEEKKLADNKIKVVLEKIQEYSKKNNLEFSFKEK